MSNSKSSVLLSPIASGEKEVVDAKAELLTFLDSHYGDAVAVENLGFGFLETAAANEKVLALTLHGIFDLINNNAATTQADFRNIALRNVSAFAFEILGKYKSGDTENTQQSEGIILRDIAPDALLVKIEQRVEAAVHRSSNSLTDERHKRLDYASNLINQGKFSQAVQYLEDLNTELWSQADNKFKYRLLVNLGMATLGVDEFSDGATKFVEALQYNPEDDQAIAYAAMGYVFQKDRTSAEKLIEQALQKNPANTLAHSLCIRIAPATKTIASVLEQIPSAYHDSSDVLVALGDKALNRGLYDKAEEWLQAALNCDNSNSTGMETVKAGLGLALMKPNIQNYPLMSAGQLLDIQKQRLDQAITLFTEVLGGLYPDRHELSHLKFSTLSNRAGALRLLGRYDESIRDIEIALQQEPKNSYLIQQRALLAHEKGNEEEAYYHFKQILSSPETPEASLLAASALMALKRFKEAEDILNQFLETDSPDNIKWDAKRLKSDLLLKRDARKDAETILNEIANEDPENILTFIQYIRWYKHIGSEEKNPELIEKAKAALRLDNSIPDQFFLADALYSLSYYRDAAEVYEQFVDKSLNSDLSRCLLRSYYCSGNYKGALDLAQQLLDKYGPLKIISEVAAYIYHYKGDMDSVQKTCENYLQFFPEDAGMQLRLAAANYDLEKYEELDRFLDSNPNCEDFDLDAYKTLARLYKVRNRIHSFLESIYNIRHRFYDKAHVHAFYEIAYLEARKMQPELQEFEVVQDGCGVLLENELGHEQWWILEDQPNVSFAKHKLNSDQLLYQALIGKRVGDKIAQKEGFLGGNSFIVLAIVEKYFAAGKQSFSILRNQPDLDEFKMLTIPMDGDRIDSSWIQDFIEDLQKRSENFDLIKSGYISGKAPLGSAAILLNRNPIEVWYQLASGSSPFIHAWSNFQSEKFEDALIVLQKGGLIVIDPISLMTLHHLGVADDVVKLLGRFGIAQSTISLFQEMVEKAQGLQCRGFANFGVENGQGIQQEVTPEQVRQQKNFFEQIIRWVRKNCQVLPCHRALDINKDERIELNELIGLSFVDTVLIAGEPGRILYADDQCLRWYASMDAGTPGVWTQVVLNYCFVQQNSNESLYRQATLGLSILGYTYTVINSDILMEAARLTEWQPKHLYISALRALADENTRMSYAVFISVDFLRQLYLEVVMADGQFIDPRDALVSHLLTIITAKRSATKFIHKLRQEIEKKFVLIPLQKRKILEAIDAWFANSFIT